MKKLFGLLACVLIVVCSYTSLFASECTPGACDCQSKCACTEC